MTSVLPANKKTVRGLESDLHLSGNTLFYAVCSLFRKDIMREIDYAADPDFPNLSASFR